MIVDAEAEEANDVKTRNNPLINGPNYSTDYSDSEICPRSRLAASYIREAVTYNFREG